MSAPKFNPRSEASSRIRVRPYRATDRYALEELLEELQDHIVASDPWLAHHRAPGYAKPYTDELLSLVKKERGKIFLATQPNGTPLGLVAGIIPHQTALQLLELKFTKAGRVLEFYVQAPYRKLGVGRLLFDAIEDYFEAKKCEAMLVEAFGPNRQAMRFYARNGYKPRSVLFGKRLKK